MGPKFFLNPVILSFKIAESPLLIIIQANLALTKLKSNWTIEDFQGLAIAFLAAIKKNAVSHLVYLGASTTRWPKRDCYLFCFFRFVPVKL